MWAKPLETCSPYSADIKVEPMAGIEPATDGLRNRCSTAELHWHPRSAHRRDAAPNQAFPALLLLLTDAATSCKRLNRVKKVEQQSNKDTKQAGNKSRRRPSHILPARRAEYGVRPQAFSFVSLLLCCLYPAPPLTV